MNGKPKCKLVGTDGNAFAIMGRVRSTLRDNGATNEQLKDFMNKCMACESYDALLQLVQDYVDVY